MVAAQGHGANVVLMMAANPSRGVVDVAAAGARPELLHQMGGRRWAVIAGVIHVWHVTVAIFGVVDGRWQLAEAVGEISRIPVGVWEEGWMGGLKMSGIR